MATETITDTAQAAQSSLDKLADKDVDSTESEVRYMAYASRLRTALRAGTRYVAYVSSISTHLQLCSISSLGL